MDRRTARWLNFAPALAASLLIWGSAIAACIVIKAAFTLPPLANLACGVVVCGLAVLVHIRSSALASTDREILQNVFHGRERRVLSMLGLLPAGRVTS